MYAWTERLLAATDAAEMEHMMATVLPFYLAEPDKPEVAARLDEMSRVTKANLAAGQAWEGGLYQSVNLRLLLGRIACPTLIMAGELDFICGPAQAQPIASAITGSSWSCFPAAATYPASKHPRNTGKQSGNSSAMTARQFSCLIGPIPHIPRAQAVARPDNR